MKAELDVNRDSRELQSKMRGGISPSVSISDHYTDAFVGSVNVP